MNAINFEGANIVARAPDSQKDEVNDLIGFFTEGVFSSFWKPTEAELAILNAGGHIQLSILIGNAKMQPVHLSVTDQVNEVEPDECL